MRFKVGDFVLVGNSLETGVVYQVLEIHKYEYIIYNHVLKMSYSIPSYRLDEETRFLTAEEKVELL